MKKLIYLEDIPDDVLDIKYARYTIVQSDVPDCEFIDTGKFK